MSNKPPSTTLASLILLFMTIFTNQSSSARTLANSAPNPTQHHHQQQQHSHQKITFLMRDIFNATKPSIPNLTSSHQLPFSKPIGLFPPKNAVLLPETNLPSSPRAFDLPGIGLSFPAKAALQELEFGVVTDIEEDIYHPDLGWLDTYGSQLLGKAQGMFVASSEDGRSHMMAMKVKFRGGNVGDQDESGLRFFGVKKEDVSESQESHIAVIGGVGKFQGANGYATVKSVGASHNGERGAENKLLKFSVYLS